MRVANGTRFKKGTLPRLYLLLMDGKKKTLRECFSWATELISLQVAVRTYSRCGSNALRTQKALLHPEEASMEGKVEELWKSVWYASKNGWIGIDVCGSDKLDFVVWLTSKGLSNIFDRKGLWTRMMNELGCGLRMGRISLSVCSNCNQEEYDGTTRK
jgi:hypothetical protein